MWFHWKIRSPLLLVVTCMYWRCAERSPHIWSFCCNSITADSMAQPKEMHTIFDCVRRGCASQMHFSKIDYAYNSSSSSAKQYKKKKHGNITGIFNQHCGGCAASAVFIHTFQHLPWKINNKKNMHKLRVWLKVYLFPDRSSSHLLCPTPDDMTYEKLFILNGINIIILILNGFHLQEQRVSEAAAKAI